MGVSLLGRDHGLDELGTGVQVDVSRGLQRLHQPGVDLGLPLTVAVDVGTQPGVVDGQAATLHGQQDWHEPTLAVVRDQHLARHGLRPQQLEDALGPLRVAVGILADELT